MTAARKLVDHYPSYAEETVSTVKRVPAPKRRRIPATLRICLVAAACVIFAIAYRYYSGWIATKIFCYALIALRLQ